MGQRGQELVDVRGGVGHRLRVIEESFGRSFESIEGVDRLLNLQ